MMAGGLSAVCLMFGDGSIVADAVPSSSLRRLLVGALFAACVSLVAISPLGRLSGAHLNPAVTLAFRVMGRVSNSDLLGYTVVQFAGASAGALVVWLVWGSTARSVGGGVTSLSISIPAGIALEVVMTAVLIGTIFVFLSAPRLAPWTPLAIWPVITMLVWIGGPFTGTSLNPARSTGPALVFTNVTDLWLYLLAPVAGAVALALVWRQRCPVRMHPRTAKLFHDHAYPCCLGSDLPAAPP